MLELLASLHKQVASRARIGWLRETNSDPLASVACPNVQARVPRTAVDCEEVQITMEASKDSVFLSVLDKVRCSGGEKVRTGEINLS